MLTARQILGLFIVLRRRHREDTGLLSLRRKLTTYWPGHSSQETDGSTWPRWGGGACNSVIGGFTLEKPDTIPEWHGGYGVRSIALPTPMPTG